MNRPGHHVLDCAAPLGPVKPLRFAPTPSGLAGLTGTSVAPTEGHYVMAQEERPGICSTPTPLGREGRKS